MIYKFKTSLASACGKIVMIFSELEYQADCLR